MKAVLGGHEGTCPDKLGTGYILTWESNVLSDYRRWRLQEPELAKELDLQVQRNAEARQREKISALKKEIESLPKKTAEDKAALAKKNLELRNAETEKPFVSAFSEWQGDQWESAQFKLRVIKTIFTPSDKMRRDNVSIEQAFNEASSEEINSLVNFFFEMRAVNADYKKMFAPDTTS